MSNLRKTTILAAVAGALLCVGSGESGSGPLRAEVRSAAKLAEARPSQLHCRIYFGCAPIPRAGRDATHPDSE